LLRCKIDFRIKAPLETVRAFSNSIVAAGAAAPGAPALPAGAGMDY
jgi:hypothetical protein